MLNAQVCNSITDIGHVVWVVSRTFQILSVQSLSIGKSKAFMTCPRGDFMKVTFEKNKESNAQINQV